MINTKNATAWQKKVLAQANNNLRQLFPEKHCDITFEDIEKAYFRNALSVNADAKTTKGNAEGYATGILYLAASRLSGYNTCTKASDGCIVSCLTWAGRCAFYSVTKAQVIKTLALFFEMPRYEATLQKSIDALRRKAAREGMTPVVRLNGTSDLPWEKMTSLMQRNSDIQFYDYTKNDARLYMPKPKNYDLTLSLSEDNHEAVRQALTAGHRVAVVFRKEIPKTFWGFKVIDGDKHDLCFLHPQGVILGLKAKGKAKKDKSGFVQDIARTPLMTQKFVINTIDRAGNIVSA